MTSDTQIGMKNVTCAAYALHITLNLLHTCECVKSAVLYFAVGEQVQSPQPTCQQLIGHKPPAACLSCSAILLHHAGKPAKQHRMQPSNNYHIELQAQLLLQCLQHVDTRVNTWRAFSHAQNRSLLRPSSMCFCRYLKHCTKSKPEQELHASQ